MRRLRGLVGDWASDRHGRLVLLLLLQVSSELLIVGCHPLSINAAYRLGAVCSPRRQAMEIAFRVSWPKSLEVGI